MLLARRTQDPSNWLIGGGLFLAVGVLLNRFGPPVDGFWSALLAGVSGAFIGASIVLNIRGLVLRRRRSG